MSVRAQKRKYIRRIAHARPGQWVQQYTYGGYYFLWLRVVGGAVKFDRPPTFYTEDAADTECEENNGMFAMSFETGVVLLAQTLGYQLR